MSLSSAIDELKQKKSNLGRKSATFTREEKYLIKNLKQLREAKNITQRKLAILSGVSQPHIGRIENGAYMPGRKIFDRIKLALSQIYDDIPLDTQNISPQEKKNITKLEYIQKLLELSESISKKIKESDKLIKEMNSLIEEFHLWKEFNS